MNQPSKKGITIVAGTFGHLHKGHKALLMRAISTKKFIIVGITSDEYVKKTKNYNVRGYKSRSDSVYEFLREKNANFTIKPIENNSGDADKNKDYTDIIVSKETEGSARILNNKRLKNGLKPMHIHTVNTKIANDFFVLSSSRIDSGEIDEEGKRLNPLRVSIILSKNIQKAYRDSILRSVFKNSPISSSKEVKNSEIFPDFSDFKRTNSGKIMDFDYLILISEGILPYSRGSRNKVCVRSFIIDKYGTVGEGVSSSIEMTEQFYSAFVRGSDKLNIFNLESRGYFSKMILESVKSSLQCRTKPWEFGVFDRIQSV
ncbi:MAG: hypothetical protein AMDU5_GPLC00010G0127 [Thermoplasmatales archaeon Gpl]|jgi:pantetheine-phosphate adenylyltransferase|nr:MAG: hypothetical protein AMDU5_GPLC00010G0127 [Thermoplasmatales archaeon Gpl]